MHTHICPSCKETYECEESTPVWDQEDTDCRWHINLTCKDCFERAYKYLKVLEKIKKELKA